MSTEILIINLVHEEIGHRCSTGEWDWYFTTNTPTPSPTEIIIQSAQWCEDDDIQQIFLLSAMLTASELSIHLIDVFSDSEYRQGEMALIPIPIPPLAIVCYFAALYSGDEIIDDIDPQADPFYFSDRLVA